MKIRTQLLVTTVLFGLILLTVAAILFITSQQVNHLNRQEELATSVERTARELSYLTNDYLLHRENQQRQRWQSKFTELSNRLESLEPSNAEQRALINQIQNSQQRLQVIFNEVVEKVNTSTLSGVTAIDLAFIQVSWSRLEVQNQGMIFDASLLTQELNNQEDALRQQNTVLIYVMVGLFALYILSNYFVIYGRILRSLTRLRVGTRIVGSGNLNFALQDQQRDEIGELSRAFNQMTTSLREITASKTDLEREISERKRAEEALRQSEARLRRLVEANLIGVVTRDAAGQVKDANEAFLTIIGCTPEDLRSGALNILDLVPEEQREAEFQWMQAAASAGSSKPQEKVYVHRDGAYVPVLVGETQIEEGPYADFIGFVLDLTELKQAQAALAEYADKLKQSNEELEQFAFMASHDLQEPLRKIRSFGDSLVRKLGDNLEADAQDYLERMQNAAERMQNMINDLLELSRVGRRGGAFQRVDLSEVVNEVLSDLLPRIQAEQGTVEVGPLQALEADPLQMRQLLQNLIGNGIKYHKAEVPPVVRVWSEYGRPEAVGQSTSSQSANSQSTSSQSASSQSAGRQSAGGQGAGGKGAGGKGAGNPGAAARSASISVLTICVADNGIGFQEEYLERIFLPFTRLHGRGEYEGTGMGLAICKKIVERHHGSITAHSEEGQGATFYVTLPLRQS